MSVAADRHPRLESAPSSGDTLQRVILPERARWTRFPLYMDMAPRPASQLPTVGGRDGKTGSAPQTVQPAPPRKPTLMTSLSPPAPPRCRSGERVSFGTYFNAFPASYWRRWTTVDKVRLQVRTSGRRICHRLQVQRPRIAAARRHHGASRARRRTPSSCPWRPSATAAGTGSTSWRAPNRWSMVDAEWQGPAVEQHARFGHPADHDAEQDRLLPQQPPAPRPRTPRRWSMSRRSCSSTRAPQKVADADGFAEVRESLGGKLRIINQSNLGGSGGFARGMYEAVENGSDYVLLHGRRHRGRA